MKYFKESILYSIRFLDVLRQRGDLVLMGESLLQMIRDIYTWKMSRQAFHPVDILIQEMKLELTVPEQELLKTIEFSLRKQEKYLETVPVLSTEIMESIRQKALAFLG